MFNLKDCVKGRVEFQFYRKGNLYYKTENGLVFPVPVDDTGDAAFNPQDKAMLFMRWIRKELDNYGGLPYKPDSFTTDELKEAIQKVLKDNDNEEET